MHIEENALIFIGNHPDSQDPICGIITSSLDVEHAPFSYEVVREKIVITGTGKTVCFAVAPDLHAALAAGAQFYLANIGGSEESHAVPMKKATRH